MILLLFHPILGEGKLVSLVILYRVVVSLFPFLIGALVAARPLSKEMERTEEERSEEEELR